MDLRKILKYLNMRMIAEAAGVSYEILRNYSCGRKQHLTDEEFNAVVKAIKQVFGGIR